MIETDVLIVGSGPAGSTTALALATYGIKPLVVTKFNWTCRTPRAHITNQRAMEIFRDFGLEDEVKQKATPQELMGNNVFCTSLAGEELGRLYSWGNQPNRMADYTLASPTAICDIPQNLLEPILLGNAATRGARICFNTEYLSMTQDANGVTATVRDDIFGAEYQIRAKYLIGADGGRSKVAQDIGLPMEGQMGLAGSINIVFNADLTKYVAHRPSVLYWVMQPGSDVGGIGMGVVRMVRTWDKWLVIWGYDINAEPPQLTDATAIEIVHKLIGDHTIPVKIESTSHWTVNKMYATKNTSGRVFCMGDAVHRHPPSNGLGSNTSIQDAYNLSWKLAMVLKGQASPALLASYEAERAPIAKEIVERANKSIDEFKPIFEALGLLSTHDPVLMRENMAKLKDTTDEAATRREALRKAILYKSYEFNCHGVEMNQRYASSAVIADGTPEPQPKRDRELYYQPMARPGSKLPHAWLRRGDEKVSTLDIAGKGRFAVLTGIGGEAWVRGAHAFASQSGADIATFVVGPGRDVQDMYGEWAEMREVEETGCLLVRPDGYVAWRYPRAAQNAERLIADALTQILGTRQMAGQIAAE